MDERGLGQEAEAEDGDALWPAPPLLAGGFPSDSSGSSRLASWMSPTAAEPDALEAASSPLQVAPKWGNPRAHGVEVRGESASDVVNSTEAA